MLPSTRVFQVVSFRQVFPSKPCMHLSSPHPIRLTCSPPPNLVLHNLINRTVAGEVLNQLNQFGMKA